MTDAMVDVDTIMAGLDDQIHTNILILDACRNNPMAPQVASAGPSRGFEAGSGLAAPASLGSSSTLGAGTQRVRDRAGPGRARRRKRFRQHCRAMSARPAST